MRACRARHALEDLRGNDKLLQDGGDALPGAGRRGIAEGYRLTPACFRCRRASRNFCAILRIRPGGATPNANLSVPRDNAEISVGPNVGVEFGNYDPGRFLRIRTTRPFVADRQFHSDVIRILGTSGDRERDHIAGRQFQTASNRKRNVGACDDACDNACRTILRGIHWPTAVVAQPNITVSENKTGNWIRNAGH